MRQDVFGDVFGDVFSDEELMAGDEPGDVT